MFAHYSDNMGLLIMSVATLTILTDMWQHGDVSHMTVTTWGCLHITVTTWGWS